MGNLRVIGGERKGFRLASPSRGDLRPTSNRVREALFDILGERIRQSRFLDLFAGTGAVGIEALSRGALECCFVERDREVAKLIQRNLEACGLEARGRVMVGGLPQALSRLPPELNFDLVFVDPPYGHPEGESVLRTLAGRAPQDRNMLIILEHGRSWTPPAEIGRLVHRRSARYGDSLLSFFGGGGFDRPPSPPL